ncbi:MAG: aspartyl protease family protein [Bacteroidia bacterium]|nr:aspartyl protease family protein [Bacteroidia bacterium]
MRQIIIIGVAIILLSGCKNLSGKEGKDDSIADSIALPKNAVPIVYVDYIYIKGNVDSVQGNFLLDTGGDNLYIDSIFHNTNNFKYNNSYQTKIYGIGNAFQKITIIKDSVSFTFGNFIYRTSLVPVLKLKPVGGDYIDGLIGTRYFLQSVLEINYAKEYINIFKTIDSTDISDYQIVPMGKHGHNFYVPLIVKINDSTTITGNFHIDTGTPFSTFTSYVAKTYNLTDKIERKVRYYTKYGGVGGESSGYDFIADSVQISDYRLENVNMSYSADWSGVLASEGYSGILGSNILDRFDIIFDFRNSNLYLKPNKKFNEPYIFDRLGFSYVDRCKTMGGWIVASLTENSAAEKQGLRIDDKIISVNNTPVEEIPYETQEAFFKKTDQAKFVVIRADSLKTIEFGLAPLL